jgi:ACS family sodium-dependent inorganic phosphate cotransporter
MWPVFAAHVAHNYGYYTFLMWLPEYFNDELGVSLKDVGVYAVLPYAFGFVFDNAWACASDALVERWSRSPGGGTPGGGAGTRAGDPPTVGPARATADPERGGSPTRSSPGAVDDARRAQLRVRKLSQSVAFVPPMLLLCRLALGGAPSLNTALLVLTLSLGLNTASHSGYWAAMVDLDPDRAGLLCGVSNTLATLPGIYGVGLAGLMLDGGAGWSGVFGVAVLHYAAGLAAFLALARPALGAPVRCRTRRDDRARGACAHARAACGAVVVELPSRAGKTV